MKKLKTQDVAAATLALGVGALLLFQYILWQITPFAQIRDGFENLDRVFPVSLYMALDSVSYLISALGLVAYFILALRRSWKSALVTLVPSVIFLVNRVIFFPIAWGIRRQVTFGDIDGWSPPLQIPIVGIFTEDLPIYSGEVLSIKALWLHLSLFVVLFLGLTAISHLRFAERQLAAPSAVSASEPQSMIISEKLETGNSFAHRGAESEFKFCSQCGTQATKLAKFCGSCGETLGKAGT